MGVREPAAGSAAARRLVLLAVLAGCGAKSDIWVPPDVTYREAGTDDGGVREDGGSREDAPDDGRDVLEVAPCGGPCDDRNPCTTDRCDPALGCVFEPSDLACDDGLDCTRDVCDPADGCRNVSDHARCDDGDPCNGAEHCDPDLGCVDGDPPCDDGVDCTRDTCDPATGACGHETDDTACDDRVDCTNDRCDPSRGCENVPDDSSCPADEYCDPTCRGCALDTTRPHSFLTFTATSLYRIDVVSGTGEILRHLATGTSLDDLAVSADGRLWAKNRYDLWSLDRCSLGGRIVLRIEAPPIAGGPGGSLYSLWAPTPPPALPYDVVQIDPDTGETTTLGRLDYDLPRGSDLALGSDGWLYFATGGSVYSVNPESGSIVLVGMLADGTSVGEIAALAVVDGLPYLLTADGRLYRLDPGAFFATPVAVIPPDDPEGFLGAGSTP